jgi:hypothetical protein
MAMACFRLVTFFPLRPDLSLPRLNSCISRFTSLPADGEYFRRDEDEDFFAADLRAVDFLVELFFALALLRELEAFFTLLFLALDFFVPVDFFLAAFLVAFLVAITILPRKSDGSAIRDSCMESGNPARIVHKAKARREMIPGAPE